MMRQASFDDKVVLGVILCIALAFRVVGLNQPLWYDELITLYTHIQLPWSEMMSDYEMNHHYLFSFQAKLISELFGESAWALRLPALLFGVCSIGAMWILARDVAGTKAAHLSSLLLAISYHHIWFSQNARGYTELMFWCVLGVIFFLRGLKDPTMKTWLGFALALALSVFTHLTGAFFFFALGVVWLGWSLLNLIRGKLKSAEFWLPAIGFSLGGALTLLLYLPVLSGVIENAGSVGDTSGIDAMQEYQNPIWTVLEAIRTVAGGLGPLITLVALAVIGLSVLGAVRVSHRAPLFGVIVFAHIILTMALLVTLGMRVWPRFFFIDIGFLLTLIVLGVALVCDLLPRVLPFLNAKQWFGVAGVAMVLVSLALAVQNYRAPKQNIPGPIDLIASFDGDAEVFAVGFVSDVYADYLELPWGKIKSNADLKAALSGSDEMWLVVGFPARSFRAISDLDKAVEDFDLVEKFAGTLGDGNILVFKSKP